MESPGQGGGPQLALSYAARSGSSSVAKVGQPYVAPISVRTCHVDSITRTS
jgi:hypothetical protein